MKIVIAGGTGLIGQALIPELLKAGHDLKILTRRQPSHAAGQKNCEYVFWDATILEGWSQSLHGAEAVINLAGANLFGSGPVPTRWTATRKRLLERSRVLSTDLLVQAIAKLKVKPKVFLQGSAIGYYGFERGDETLSETEPAGTDFLARMCTNWEQSSEPLDAMNVRRVLLRTGLVLSREGGALAKMLTPYKLGLGGPIGDGQQWWSWIHMQDYLAALLFILNNDSLSGPVNLTGPAAVRQSEFNLSLAKNLKRPAVIPTPAFALKMVLGELSVLLLKGQRVVPQKLSESGFKFKYESLAGALAELV